jgi:hypothetical protein
MKILFFGDIVGRIGRKAVALAIEEIRESHELDLIIANAENIAHGKGITTKTLEEMVEAGVDLFTSGNHVWRNKEVLTVMSDRNLGSRLLRPANYPSGVPGQGSKLLTIATKKVLVINLLGRVYGNDLVDDPFRTFDDTLLSHASQNPSVILVDFHAEATSEKVALGWHAAGRASAVWGTHTHVPTADAKILPGGTAYITDAGMCGFSDGVLGVTKGPIISNFRTQLPVTHEIPDSGDTIVSAVIITVDAAGRATNIEQWQKTYNL